MENELGAAPQGEQMIQPDTLGWKELRPGVSIPCEGSDITINKDAFALAAIGAATTGIGYLTYLSLFAAQAAH